MNAAALPALSLSGTDLAAALRAGIHRLISCEEIINKINVFPVPDGDTGTNLALTLQAVLGALRGNPDPHAGQTLTRVADAALDGARGNKARSRTVPARTRRPRRTSPLLTIEGSRYPPAARLRARIAR
jgi:hypothetical protein